MNSLIDIFLVCCGGQNILFIFIPFLTNLVYHTLECSQEWGTVFGATPVVFRYSPDTNGNHMWCQGSDWGEHFSPLIECKL